MSADSCKYTWRAVTANSIHNDWGSQDPWPEESHNPYTPFAVKQCHCKPDAIKKKGTLNFFFGLLPILLKWVKTFRYTRTSCTTPNTSVYAKNLDHIYINTM